MLSILSIVLFCTGICQCIKENNEILLSYPIEGTSYIVHFDKQLRETQFTEYILDKRVSLNGTSFYAKLDNGDTFQGAQNGYPVLPKHPLFVKRKTDSVEGMIRIEIDWSKDYFASEKPQFTMEMILYNFRGDKLGEFDISKTDTSNNILTHTTNIQPLTAGQQYTDNADAHDLLMAVFRPKIGDGKSLWAVLLVYPDQLINAKGIATVDDWDLNKIIQKQSTFMSMSMLVPNNQWKEDAFKFGMLTLFSQTAGMTKEEFTKDKYLSAIGVPKSGSSGTYSIRDIGRRSGAGFGLLYWNNIGHRFSQKFVNNFKSDTDNMIDNAKFQQFVKICFEYGQILDARTQQEKDEGRPETNYRNKVGNDDWSYNFKNHPITGNRKMNGETVEEISWTLDTAINWKTSANGKINAK